MKKLITIAIIALTANAYYGQDLANRVPANSQYVATINSPNILSKMSIQEMERLPFVMKELNAFVINRNGYRANAKLDQGKGFNDLGFDFNQQSYAFVEVTDSVTYYGYIVALNNKSNFEAMNDSSMQLVMDSKGVKAIGKRKEMIAWNKKYAIFLNATSGYNYFKDNEEIYDRYGMPKDTTFPSYYSRYEDQDKIVKVWMKAKVKSFFGKKNSKNAKLDFVKSADENAAVSVWSQGESFASNYFGYIGAIIGTKHNSFPGSEVNYYLYLNEKDITVKSSVTLSEENKKSYANMFDNQLNPKFFDYIDKDQFLSYYISAYSVTGVLQEMPNLINNYLGTSFEKYGMKESLELLSVVIDEEAIGKVVCGDAIFVLSDIANHEVTYIDYDWNEDYTEKKEVTRTKKEVVPEFLYMMSTKDEGSIHKIMKLAMKGSSAMRSKEKLIKEEGYYSLLPYRNAPFKLYFVVRDGIVFILNSDEKLQDILTNKKVNKLSTETMKDMEHAPFRTYIDGKKIMDKFSKTMGESTKSPKNLKMLDHFTKNVGSLSVYQNKMMENGLSIEAKYTFTNDEPNGLKHVLNLIDELYQMEKGDR